MRKLIFLIPILLLASLTWAQSSTGGDDTAQMRQEIEQLRKTINALEQRIALILSHANRPDPRGRRLSTLLLAR